MGTINNCLGVIDESAAEYYVRNGNEQGLLVNRFEKTFGRHLNTLGGYRLYAHSTFPLRLPKVHYRRKIKIAVNYFVALPGKIET